MTAEIAIMNKQAVAIAADSAATFSDGKDQKIFSSANKIFKLSREFPVGVMIYGSASFMGMPWETIIKTYRQQFNGGERASLIDYGNDFIEFLESDISICSPEFQTKYEEGAVSGTIESIFQSIVGNIKKQIEEHGEIDPKSIKKIISERIKYIKKTYNECEVQVPNYKKHKKNLRSKLDALLSQQIIDKFERLPLTKQQIIDLGLIVIDTLLKFPDEFRTGNISGIVISGFGKEDLFPSVVAYEIEIRLFGVLKYLEKTHNRISRENYASIMPFAQRDMVNTFIEGISPEIKYIMDQLLYTIIDEYPSFIIKQFDDEVVKANKRDEFIDKIKQHQIDALKEKLQAVTDYQTNNYVSPVLSVVAHLPKDELASMAESLVNLTCLRKKISMDQETVGGPIDVAVISKGDGFVWIKRKHYFSPEFNRVAFTRH